MQSLNIPEELKRAIANDNIVFFVGAGLSIPLGLPSYTDLLDKTLNDLAKEDSNYRPTYENYISTRSPIILNELEGKKDYILKKFAQYLTLDKNSSINFVLQKSLWYVSGKVITTNSDKALDLVAPEGTSIINFPLENKRKSFSGGNCLVKLHGSIDKPASQVFFEQDIASLYMSSSATVSFLKEVFQTQTVVFIGYGFHDPILRYILQLSKAEGVWHYFITAKSDMSLEQYGIKTIDVGDYGNIEEFLRQMTHYKVRNPKPYVRYEDIFLDDAREIDPVLDARDVAQELAKIIDNMSNERGMMIGIFGKWGRGKTFLMDLIWKELDMLHYKNNFHRVDFHAWRYQDTPASWAYLYETLAAKYLSGSNWLLKFFKVMKLNAKRQGLIPVILFVLTVIYATITYLLFKSSAKTEIVKNAFPVAGLGALAGLFAIYKNYRLKALDLFKKYSKKHTFKGLLGMQSEIQTELKTLLKSWIPKIEKEKNKRILLFVDDMDRCSEERIIQIIDSLRVMLEEDGIYQRVIVVAAADERILKRAIMLKYRNMLSTKKDDENTMEMDNLVKEYMDKIFLSGIRLADLNQNERREILGALIGNKVAPDEISSTMEEKSSAVAEKEDSAKLKANAPLAPDTPADTIVSKFDDLYSPGGPTLNRFQNESESEASQAGNPKIRYELSHKEYSSLLEALNYFPEVTPRQIRVFYYRYLLARNLLNKRLMDLNLFSMHMRYIENGVLPKLLIVYSDCVGQKKFKDYMGKLDSMDGSTCEMSLFNDQKFSISKEILKEIYKILELVVAY